MPMAMATTNTVFSLPIKEDPSWRPPGGAQGFDNILKSEDTAEHEAKECGKDTCTADDSGKINMLESVKKISADQ